MGISRFIVNGGSEFSLFQGEFYVQESDGLFKEQGKK